MRFDFGINHRIVKINDKDELAKDLFYLFLNDIDDELVFNIIPQIEGLWNKWLKDKNIGGKTNE